MRYFLVLVVLLALASSPLGAHAQGASPEASPSTAVCDALELPPGTPTTMEETEAATAGATPDHGTDHIEATPETVSEDLQDAAPAVAATPSGSPANEATSQQVIAATENLVACLNTGNYLGFATLVTPDYLLTEFGMPNPYDLPVFLEGFPGQDFRSVSDLQVHEDGRLSANVTTVVGGTQVDHFRASFVERDGQLLLDEEQSLPVEEADITVEVTMVDFAFELSEDTIPADSMVAFNVVNQGEYLHVFVVVRLPGDLTVDEVLADPSLVEQVQFLGGAFAEPGEVGHLALVGLEPGTYTAVCLVDVPDGVTHVLYDMVAEFVI